MRDSPLKKKPRGLTIADLTWNQALRCGTCGKAFIASSPIQVQKQYVVVHCQQSDCGCMTPFRRPA